MAAISVHQTEGDEDLLQVGRQGRTQLHGGQLQASLRTWFEGRAKGRVECSATLKTSERNDLLTFHNR